MHNIKMEPSMMTYQYLANQVLIPEWKNEQIMLTTGLEDNRQCMLKE